MQFKNIVDVYPLSPMQEAMLFHTCTQQTEDILFNQSCFEVTGSLNCSIFEQAWQLLIQRHAVLRSAFVWQGLKKPQQIVRNKVDLPFSLVDISDQSPTQQDASIEACKLDDKELAFNPLQAPLMRLIVLKKSEDAHYFIWSSHHLIMDRWCIPVVFKELSQHYQSLLELNAPTLNTPPQFKQYIKWIQQQDRQQSRQYWQQHLRGYQSEQAFIKLHTETIDASHTRTHNWSLFGEQVNKIRVHCQTNRITMASFIQSAWGLLIHHFTHNQQVRFGIVVSGRPHTLAGVEDMLGCFVNNLPVQVNLDESSNLQHIYTQCQQHALQRGPHEHVAISQIQEWCSGPSSQLLFDTLLVWLATAEIPADLQLKIEPVPSQLQTTYPLTLTIEERQGQLYFTATLGAHASPITDLRSIAQTFIQIVESMLELSAEDKLLDWPFSQLARQGHDKKQYALGATTHSLASDSQISEAQLLAIQKGRETVEIESIKEFLHIQWQHLLNCKSVSADASFFSLGGNSLLAATLKSTIEQAFRKKVPLIALFNGPTINEMAHTLFNEDWPNSANVATGLNMGGKHPALFCIASPEVNTLGYASLATQLGGDFPVYILQSTPDIAKMRQITAAELPELAALYIKEMQKIQPEGSYHILGMCTGAQISIEMGRQLEAQNQSIKFISVVNTWAFYTVSRLYHLTRFINQLRYYHRRIKSLSLVELYTQITYKLKPNLPVGTTATAANLNTGQNVDMVVGTDSDHNDDYSLINDVGWEARMPDLSKVKAPLIVFKLSKQPYWRINDKTLGWRKQAEQIDVEMLPGNEHFSIFREPWVGELSLSIAARLTQS